MTVEGLDDCLREMMLPTPCDGIEWVLSLPGCSGLLKPGLGAAPGVTLLVATRLLLLLYYSLALESLLLVLMIPLLLMLIWSSILSLFLTLEFVFLL